MAFNDDEQEFGSPHPSYRNFRSPTRPSIPIPPSPRSPSRYLHLSRPVRKNYLRSKSMDDRTMRKTMANNDVSGMDLRLLNSFSAETAARLLDSLGTLSPSGAPTPDGDRLSSPSSSAERFQSKGRRVVILRPYELTEESFAPYGKIVGLGGKGGAQKQGSEGKGAILEETGGVPCLRIEKRQHQPLRFGALFHHQRVAKCLGALGQQPIWFIAVASPTVALSETSNVDKSASITPPPLSPSAHSPVPPFSASRRSLRRCVSMQERSSAGPPIAIPLSIPRPVPRAASGRNPLPPSGGPTAGGSQRWSAPHAPPPRPPPRSQSPIHDSSELPSAFFGLKPVKTGQGYDLPVDSALVDGTDKETGSKGTTVEIFNAPIVAKSPIPAELSFTPWTSPPLPPASVPILTPSPPPAPPLVLPAHVSTPPVTSPPVSSPYTVSRVGERFLSSPPDRPLSSRSTAQRVPSSRLDGASFDSPLPATSPKASMSSLPGPSSEGSSANFLSRDPEGEQRGDEEVARIRSRAGHVYTPPNLDDVKLFAVRGTCFIQLHRGTWHSDPLFTPPEMDFYCLDHADTKDVDQTIFSFTRRHGLVFDVDLSGEAGQSSASPSSVSPPPASSYPALVAAAAAAAAAERRVAAFEGKETTAATCHSRISPTLPSASARTPSPPHPNFLLSSRPSSAFLYMNSNSDSKTNSSSSNVNSSLGNHSSSSSNSNYSSSISSYSSKYSNSSGSASKSATVELLASEPPPASGAGGSISSGSLHSRLAVLRQSKVVSTADGLSPRPSPVKIDVP